MILDLFYLILLAPGLRLAAWAQWKGHIAYSTAQQIAQPG
jgi:hypothetical protein